MSILSRIRDNIGLVAIIIFIALLAFILTDFVSGVSSIFGGPPSVGSVNGTTISAKEFNDSYTNAMNNYSAQGAVTDELRYQVMDQVWTQLVSQSLYDQEFKKVGLQVSGAEVYDMFTGTNINPIVRQYLMRPDEVFDANEMKRRLEQISNDPELRPQLAELEKFLVQNRGIEQYQKMIQSGYLSSLAMARHQYQDQNTKASIEWMVIPFSSIPDSLVKITDNDLKAYINSHEARFEQKDDEVVLRYVRFPIKPSPGDSTRTLASIEKLRAPFAKTEDDSAFVAGRSRSPFVNDYQPLNTFSELIRDSLRAATAGQVIGPVRDGGYYQMYKLIGTSSLETPAVKINHILISFKGNTPADSAEAKAKAAEVKGKANSGNFATLAVENSDDFASKSNGGELGWTDLAQFGESFEKTVSSASAGSIVGPVLGRGGYHVVQITDKTTTGYKVALAEQEIFFGSETEKSVYRTANQFAAKAQDAGNINDAAATAGMVALESNPLLPNSKTINGLQSARQLILWGVGAEVGAFSEVMSIGETYVVAQVTRRRNAGIRDLEDVRDEVTVRVSNEKKADMILEKLKSISGSDLVSMQKAYGQGANLGNANDITFEMNSVPGLGAEPKVIGRTFGMKQGETSAPIEGNSGVFVVKVTAKTDAPQADEATLANLRDNDRASGRNLFMQRLEPAMEEIGKVKDERYKAGY